MSNANLIAVSDSKGQRELRRTTFAGRNLERELWNGFEMHDFHVIIMQTRMTFRFYGVIYSTYKSIKNSNTCKINNVEYYVPERYVVTKAI